MNITVPVMLAAVEISDKGLVRNLLMILLIGLAIAVIWLMGWYFFRKPPVPPLVLVIWNGFFVLVGGIAIVNFLLGLAGHQFIAW